MPCPHKEYEGDYIVLNKYLIEFANYCRENISLERLNEYYDKEYENIEFIIYKLF